MIEHIGAMEGDEADRARTPFRRRLVELGAVLAGFGIAAMATSPSAWSVAAATGRSPWLLTFSTVALWWLAVVAIVRSDLRDFIIPDAASAAVAALGLVQAMIGTAFFDGDWAEAGLAGAAALSKGLAGFALFWLVGWLFRRFGKREALGFGDVKLAGASAIWLAPADAALALEIAALGAIAALMLASRRGALRDTAVPFGAFLAPAAWLVFVLGPMSGAAAPW